MIYAVKITFNSIVVCLLFTVAAYAQQLKPGFDVEEYTGVLERSAFSMPGSTPDITLPKQTQFHKVYSSPDAGMHNQWSMWLNTDNTVLIIHLRGSVATPDSWIENFYAAMIPATGTLQLDNKTTFNYKFAADPKAMVHVGWAVGIGSLAQDITEHLKNEYALGVKQVIIEGHSQGAALAFLLRSYLYYQMQERLLPADLTIKTYCSAAPKPGNLYYAYDFEYINRGGWAYTVVNAADWVPELPFSIQSLTDINPVNPITNVKKGLKKQKFVVRVVGGYVYARLNNSTRKAKHKYQKYLGKALYHQVKKYMKEYKQPAYSGSFAYARAGTPVVLEPDADYYKHFPDTGANMFRNHMAEPYYYLLKKAYK